MQSSFSELGETWKILFSKLLGFLKTNRGK
jgi:hypothetical protein